MQGSKHSSSLVEESSGSVQLPRSEVDGSLEDLLIEDSLVILLEDIRTILYT